MSEKKAATKTTAKKDDTVDIPVTEVPEIEAAETEAPEPKKRGPGRPRGSTNKTASKTASGRGPGRPRKTANKKAADIGDLAKQLVGIHQLIAMATGFPEVQIHEDEGMMLAQGFTAVADEYGLALSGKTGAAIQLFGACAMVYVPRAMMIRKKIDAQRAAQRQAEESNTVDVDVTVVPDIPGSGEGAGYAPH